MVEHKEAPRGCNFRAQNLDFLHVKYDARSMRAVNRHGKRDTHVPMVVVVVVAMMNRHGKCDALELTAAAAVDLLRKNTTAVAVDLLRKNTTAVVGAAGSLLLRQRQIQGEGRDDGYDGDAQMGIPLFPKCRR